MARFGDLLRDLRKSVGVSQAVLATELGWNQSKVSYLEGLDEVPKEDDLSVVCRYFGVGPEYFYDRRGDRKPRAIAYLQSLATLPPEASPKKAIAFYSQMDRLTKEDQGRIAGVVERHIRSTRPGHKRS